MPVAAAEQLEGFTAKLFTAKGTVECLKAGTTEWKAVKAPYMLEAGDQVRTGAKGKAEIYMRYGAKVRLEKDTHFEVSKVAPEGNVVQVLRGKMHAWIRKFKGRGFSVRTPTAVCAVRGTTFSVEYSGATLLFDLYGGGLEVTDMRNNSVILQPGQRLELTPGAAVPPVPVAIPPGVIAPSEPAAIKEEKAEIKAEQIIMQQQAAAAVAPQPDPEPIQEVVVQEPVTTVIPTATVQQSQEVSGSTPEEEGPDQPY